MIKSIKLKINLLNLIDHLSGSYSLFYKKGGFYFNQYILNNNNIRKKLDYKDLIITIDYLTLIDGKNISLELGNIEISKKQKEIINSILGNEILLKKELGHILTSEQKITNIRNKILFFYDLFRTFHIKDNIYTVFYFDIDNKILSLKNLNNYFSKKQN